MSTSPFMDDYSSEDYSDHDDDYYFVPTATSPPQVLAQVEIDQTQSNELQNLIIDQQQKDVSESMYFDVLPELEAETAEEGGGMEQSVYLAVESYFDLEAQAETSVAAVLEAETTVEELAVGSYIDLEAQVETGVAAALEAETTVEELAVGSYFDLEAQVETGVGGALETETVVEEGNVIESESLETVEADTVVETVERMIEEFIYEAVESESEAIEEPNSDVEHEADAVASEAETAVEEGDVIGESIYKALESDYDLDAEAEDMVEEENDVVEEEDDMVEEEEVMVEVEDDMVEEEDDFVEELDVIDKPLEAEALVDERAAIEESIYEPLELNSDLQAEEPEALAEPALSIEMTTFKGQEPEEPEEEPEDLIDELSDSCEEGPDLSEEEGASDVEESDLNEKERDSDVEVSDLNEKEWDSDAEEIDIYPEDSDMDSSDSDVTEEEEDDVVVSYLKSTTTIRSKAWKNFVPVSALAWARLPVTETTTFEDSSLESFLGCGPMLVLQECGNAMMNVIETLLCELLRIRNGLRRVLGALFRKRGTTKHT